MTNPTQATQSDTLQDRLTRIFDDARGSDTLFDLLDEFEFESSRELAEALTVWASSKLFQETAVKIAEYERILIKLGELECPKCSKFGDDCGEHVPSELSLLMAQNKALREALEPFVDGYPHTMFFLQHKEIMHPAGRSLYTEDVDHAYRVLAALGGDRG